MKKITITLLLFVFVLKVMGQVSPLSLPKQATYIPKNLPKSFKANLNSNTNLRSTNKYLWVNYGEAIAQLYGTSQSSGNFLFPDSSVLVHFSDGNGGSVISNPWIHNIGNVFDAYSNNLQMGYQQGGVNFSMPTSEAYLIDSISLTYAYTRNTDTSIVDTLVMYYFQSSSSFDIPTFYYKDQAANYGYDTIFVPFIKYNYINNALSDSIAPIQSVKILLKESDTSVTLFAAKSVALPTVLHVAAGNLVVSAFAFHPGYHYSAGDVIDSVDNAFTFQSFDENPGNYPYWFPGDYYNVSSIVPNTVRYNIDSQGYNGYFIPDYAYTSGYSLDDHGIFYHIGIDSTQSGINKLNNVVVDQTIYPNPASDVAMLEYKLMANSSVIINIYNVAGQLVKTMNEGNVIAGANRQLLDTQDLSNGVYLVSVETNGVKSVSKLVISR